MDASKKWRFRFGLRTLFLVTIICAIGSQLYVNHSELAARVARLKPGMTEAEVNEVLGMQPFSAAVSGGTRRVRETYLEERQDGERHVWATVKYKDGIVEGFSVSK